MPGIGYDLVIALGALGSILTAVFAAITFRRIASKAVFKTETIYGQEAEERYIKIKDRLSKDEHFGPYVYGGIF